MRLLLSLLLPAAALAAPRQQHENQDTAAEEDVCLPIATQGSFNLTEWVRASWFIQEQQLNGFQQPEDLYCVLATYELEGRTVPLFDGTVVSVYNYQNRGAVNGPGSDPEMEPLCARLIDPERPSDSIINAPCFLPNALAGPYWVVAAGPSPERYEWGIVSAGPPTVPAPEGEAGCTTSETGVNDSGLWLFHRRAIISEQELEDIRTVARMNGFTTSRLRAVLQEDPETGERCEYVGEAPPIMSCSQSSAAPAAGSISGLIF
jgi:apolipoprotein D and lipocalin family protein